MKAQKMQQDFQLKLKQAELAIEKKQAEIDKQIEDLKNQPQ